jgi:uracil-DNA glycosylase
LAATTLVHAVLASNGKNAASSTPLNTNDQLFHPLGGTSLMTKGELLKIEAQKIKNCHQCKIGKIGKAVFGEGSLNAQIMFVGEAPGRQEAKTGRPFIGRSGQFLRSLIRQIGLKEEEIYITSPVKYLPKRGTPSQSDVKHGTTHLIRQFAIINPKIVVLLGNIAYRALIDNFPSANSKHGQILRRNGQSYFVTFHPAAAVRFPKIKVLMKEDFEKLWELIQKPN